MRVLSIVAGFGHHGAVKVNKSELWQKKKVHSINHFFCIEHSKNTIKNIT